jgi:hypothetical protein
LKLESANYFTVRQWKTGRDIARLAPYPLEQDDVQAMKIKTSTHKSSPEWIIVKKSALARRRKRRTTSHRQANAHGRQRPPTMMKTCANIPHTPPEGVASNRSLRSIAHGAPFLFSR